MNPIDTILLDAQEVGGPDLGSHLRSGGSIALVYEDTVAVIQLLDGTLDVTIVAGYHKIPKSLNLSEEG